MSEPVQENVPQSLDDILAGDVDGLLDAPQKPKKVTSSDRLERAFLEIVEFRREHERVPSSTTREIAERKLGARLDGILANDEKIEALKHLDEFGLLDVSIRLVEHRRWCRSAPSCRGRGLGGQRRWLLGFSAT